MKKVDLAGHRFGSLEVIARSRISDSGNQLWLCRCDCGAEIEVQHGNLRSGNSTKCRSCAERIHGHATAGSSLTYTSWHKMTQRCCNPNDDAFHYYSGRGIKVCDRWMIFANFLEDMGERPSRKHSIDRIDNNGNYEPGNCRWTVQHVQNRNKRTNFVVTFKGKTQCLKDWALEYRICAHVLRQRLVKCKWDFERALTTPVQHR